jgi:Holliday junction resolvase RusA-like endonuclease
MESTAITESMYPTLKAMIQGKEITWDKNRGYAKLPWEQENPPEGVEVKKVPGTEMIWADSNGDVWSTASGFWRKLTESVTYYGYRQVNFKKNGKHFTTGAHRLVAAAFHGPCPDGMECMHLNDNPSDNRPVNLKWGTKEENNREKRYPQTYAPHLTPDHRTEIIRLKKEEKWSHTRIANFFGITYHQVALLLSGRTYNDTKKRRYSKGLVDACNDAASFLEDTQHEDEATAKAYAAIAKHLRNRGSEIKRRSKT